MKNLLGCFCMGLASGSAILVEKLTEFKGEELQFKAMNEMDFEEYLWAKDEKSLAELIKESYAKHKTCPFHKVALELFQEYLMTGGFPEAV